jgi:S1-C subfamily serine protease
LPFFRNGIPVMFFTTGTHADYHRTSDTFDKLNIPGMRQVVNFVADVIVEIANAPERPKFVGGGAGPPAVAAGRPMLGVVPDASRQGEGLAVAGVLPGGPADRAGIKPGDVITELAGQKISGLADLEKALEKCKAGREVRAVIRRGGQTLELQVTVEGPPQPAAGRSEPLGKNILVIALAC